MRILTIQATVLFAFTGGLLQPHSNEAQETNRQTWEIDNTHSSVIFAISHHGLSYVYGRFNTCSGKIQLDGAIPDKSTFLFTIDPASVDTNNEKRDENLRGSNFFDVEQYDNISFKSTSVEYVELEIPGTKTRRRTYMASGNLTMHGETRNIKIPLELISVGKGADGKDRCGFMAKFIIQRSSHGMDFMSDVVGDNVAITFCFQAVVDDSPKLDAILEKDSDSAKTGSKKVGGESSMKTTPKPNSKTSDEKNSIEDLFKIPN